MGDKVHIKVVAANLTKRQLDFEWVIKQSDDSQNLAETDLNKNSDKKHRKGKVKEKVLKRNK